MMLQHSRLLRRAILPALVLVYPLLLASCGLKAGTEVTIEGTATCNPDDNRYQLYTTLGNSYLGVKNLWGYLGTYRLSGQISVVKYIDGQPRAEEEWADPDLSQYGLHIPAPDAG